MTFTISIRELVASLLVLPPSVETSATFIFAQFEQGEVSIGMAMAVVSVWTYNTMFITSATYGAKTKRGSMMRIEVWGGAGEYGRSCYFVKNKETKILFDCGINRSYEDSYPKIEREVVPFLDAVFLSHIHEDHTMGLPLLAKYGYKKKNMDNSLYEGATPSLL